MLLTRAPVAGRYIATSPLPLDLHVLSLSLAFILSQDQTLRCFYIFSDLYNFDLSSRTFNFAGAVPVLSKVDGSACLDLLR